jgi:MFS family permease
LTPQQRRDLRIFWIEGGIWGAAESLTTPFISLYALSFGATSAQIGLLSSFASLLTGLGLWPGAYLGSRWGHKLVAILTYKLLYILMPAAMALLPLVFRGEAIIYGIIALYACQLFFNSAGIPSWTVVAGYIVPRDIRGRYLSFRSSLQTLMALLLVPLVGALIRVLPASSGYQISFAAAAVIGIISIVLYARLPEPEATSNAAGPDAGFWRAVRHDRGYLLFIAAAIAWALSLTIVEPFYNVFLVRELDLDTGTIALLASITTASRLIAFRVFGPLGDRIGEKRALVYAGILAPLARIAFLFVRTAWHVAPVSFYAGFFQGGFDLVAFNLFLAVAPTDRQAQFNALYRTLVAVGSFTGPLIGGMLYERFGFHANLLISAAGLLGTAATYWLLAVRKRKSN